MGFQPSGDINLVTTMGYGQGGTITPPPTQDVAPSFFGAPAWHYLKKRPEYLASWLLSEEEEIKEEIAPQQVKAVEEFFDELRFLEGETQRQMAFLAEEKQMTFRLRKIIAQIEEKRELELEDDDAEAIRIIMRGM